MAQQKWRIGREQRGKGDRVPMERKGETYSEMKKDNET